MINFSRRVRAVGERAAKTVMYKLESFLLRIIYAYFRSPAGISPRAENKNVWNRAGQGPFRITPARGRSSGAPKNACVFRGRPNLVEPAWPSQGPQGPQRFLR